MYPLIRSGDVVEITPAAFDEVDVGDVVLFRAEDRLLVHRVIGHTLEGQCRRLRVRGDRFLQENLPVDRADVLGRVDIVYRNQRTMRLDCGLNRHLGSLVATNQLVHLCMRWVAQNRQRYGGLGRKLRALRGDDQEEATARPVGGQS